MSVNEPCTALETNELYVPPDRLPLKSMIKLWVPQDPLGSKKLILSPTLGEAGGVAVNAPAVVSQAKRRPANGIKLAVTSTKGFCAMVGRIIYPDWNRFSALIEKAKPNETADFVCLPSYLKNWNH